MAEIEFVIVPTEVPIAIERLDCIEPVIDGMGLVDRVARFLLEREPYLGMFDVAGALEAWTPPMTGDAVRNRVLGCVCGDSGCSSVSVTARSGDGYLEWSDFVTSDGKEFHGLGPFRFDHQQYLDAWTRPRRSTTPVREEHDLDALAAGRPADPDDWLNAMSLAFGRSFHSFRQSELTQQTFSAGLRARAAAGIPLGDDAIRRWARRLNPTSSQEAVEGTVQRFRQVARS